MARKPTKHDKKGVTVEVSSGGRTTGPMTGGIDPKKFAAVVEPILAEPTKPPGKVKKITEYLRYDFTRIELVERAQDLARTLQEIQRLEDNLASLKKSIQSQVAEQEAKRNRLSNCVAAGYEMRDVACEVRFNLPSSKLKTIIRVDTYATVNIMAMDSYECQEELNFEKALDAEKPAENATPAQAAAAAPVPEPEKTSAESAPTK